MRINPFSGDRARRKRNIKRCFFGFALFVGISVANGGFPNQRAAVVYIALQGYEYLKSPFIDAKKNSRAYSDKAWENKRTYDEILDY